MALTGKVCLVTGASRGIGKGIALQLGEAGATVYITGRSSSPDVAKVGGSLQETESEISSRGGRGIAVVCDHSNDEAIKQLFEKIKKDHGKLDVLVNNAYSAVDSLFNELKSGRKFWQCEREPGQWWDHVNSVGLRNHYICSTYAAQMMTEARQGLIVNISSLGGIRYLFNVAYGVGKAAVDRMSSDMAVEMKPFGVACVTLYPGPVMTELIGDATKSGDSFSKGLAKTFNKAETPEFSGKAVAGLASDSNIMAKSGRICLSAELAHEYKFVDINGVQPPSMLQLNVALNASGHTWMAAIVPDFIRIPGFVMAIGASKL